MCRYGRCWRVRRHRSKKRNCFSFIAYLFSGGRRGPLLAVVGAVALEHIVDRVCVKSVGQWHRRHRQVVEAVDFVAALAVEVYMHVAGRTVGIASGAQLEFHDATAVLYGVYDVVRGEQIEHAVYA